MSRLQSERDRVLPAGRDALQDVDDTVRAGLDVRGSGQDVLAAAVGTALSDHVDGCLEAVHDRVGFLPDAGIDGDERDDRGHGPIVRNRTPAVPEGVAYDLVIRRVAKIRPELRGRACRILVHPGGRSGSRLVELDTGERVVTLGAYLRRSHAH